MSYQLLRTASITTKTFVVTSCKLFLKVLRVGIVLYIVFQGKISRKIFIQYEVESRSDSINCCVVVRLREIQERTALSDSGRRFENLTMTSLRLSKL